MYCKNLSKTWIFSLIFLLTACVQSTTKTIATATPMDGDVVTPYPSQTIPAVSTTQPLPIFTRTPIPASLSPTISNTATPTISIFVWQPTQNPIAATIIPQASVKKTENISPDKSWIIVTSDYRLSPPTAPGEADPDWVQTLHLVHVPTGKETLLEQGIYISSGGIGWFGIEVLFWSANSRYVYYTTQAYGAPDGLCYCDRSIVRVNVIDGSIARFSEGPISPNGNQMLSRQWDKIGVFDLENGVGDFTDGMFTDAPVVAMAWSPDSNAVVYAQTGYDTNNPANQGTAHLVYMEIKTMMPTLLLESDQFSFPGGPGAGGLTWNTPDTILISGANENWAYNFKTGELVATP